MHLHRLGFHEIFILIFHEKIHENFHESSRTKEMRSSKPSACVAGIGLGNGGPGFFKGAQGVASAVNLQPGHCHRHAKRFP